jgi:peptide/nickel transport system ATP-binding protein
VTTLELRDLKVTYQVKRGRRVERVEAVKGVDLVLEAGDTVGIAGESGCGKSTIASSVLRLLPSDAEVTGQILLNGQDVMSMNPGRLRGVRWADSAIVFQGALHSLNPVQRVGAQVAEAILLHSNVSRRTAAQQVGELFEQVGLPAARAEAYPHQLSGGQRQRVLIALALSCDPQLLIADEPTTALDVMVQAQVLDLLGSLQRERAMSMILITHDLSVLQSVCDRLAVMYGGRIVEEGPSNEVFADPVHPYTKALAASFPTIGDPASRMAPRGLRGDPPDPGQDLGGCAFHPRCDEALPSCSTNNVVLQPCGTSRRAACVLVEKPAS